jgi:hypothetical protein
VRKRLTPARQVGKPMLSTREHDVSDAENLRVGFTMLDHPSLGPMIFRSLQKKPGYPFLTKLCGMIAQEVCHAPFLQRSLSMRITLTE